MNSIEDFRKHILEATFAHLSELVFNFHHGHNLLNKKDVENFEMICGLIMQAKEDIDEDKLE